MSGKSVVLEKTVLDAKALSAFISELQPQVDGGWSVCTPPEGVPPQTPTYPYIRQAILDSLRLTPPIYDKHKFFKNKTRALAALDLYPVEVHWYIRNTRLTEAGPDWLTDAVPSWHTTEVQPLLAKRYTSQRAVLPLHVEFRILRDTVLARYTGRLWIGVRYRLASNTYAVTVTVDATLDYTRPPSETLIPDPATPVSRYGTLDYETRALRREWTATTQPVSLFIPDSRVELWTQTPYGTTSILRDEELGWMAVLLKHGQLVNPSSRGTVTATFLRTAAAEGWSTVLYLGRHCVYHPARDIDQQPVLADLQQELQRTPAAVLATGHVAVQYDIRLVVLDANGAEIGQQDGTMELDVSSRGRGTRFYTTVYGRLVAASPEVQWSPSAQIRAWQDLEYEVQTSTRRLRLRRLHEAIVYDAAAAKDLLAALPQQQHLQVAYPLSQLQTAQDSWLLYERCIADLQRLLRWVGRPYALEQVESQQQVLWNRETGSEAVDQAVAGLWTVLQSLIDQADIDLVYQLPLTYTIGYTGYGRSCTIGLYSGSLRLWYDPQSSIVTMQQTITLRRVGA